MNYLQIGIEKVHASAAPPDAIGKFERLKNPHFRVNSPHADLRVSLREMRAGQRNPGALHRLAGHALSALRFDETGQEIFHVRRQRRRGRTRL